VTQRPSPKQQWTQADELGRCREEYKSEELRQGDSLLYRGKGRGMGGGEVVEMMEHYFHCRNHASKWGKKEKKGYGLSDKDYVPTVVGRKV